MGKSVLSHQKMAFIMPISDRMVQNKGTDPGLSTVSIFYCLEAQFVSIISRKLCECPS